MTNPLLEAIQERRLVGDGAMGTQLQQAGLESGGCGEQWNLTHPERIAAIQKAYVEAGSDCLITNTFGGSRIMLDRHAPDMDVAGINRAAVQIARESFGDRKGFVIGDIGPFGGLLEPYGDFTEARVTAAISEQAEALMEGGADALIIETQTVLEEIGIGIEAAKKAGCTCIIASIAFDLTQETREIRTMMGVDPDRATDFILERGAHILALNCGTGIEMDNAREVVEIYHAKSDLAIMAQPNAGLPVLEKLKVVYKQTPEDMAGGVPGLLEAGASIIGGCCGSTPDHIRLIRQAVDAFNERGKTNDQT